MAKKKKEEKEKPKKKKASKEEVVKFTTSDLARGMCEEWEDFTIKGMKDFLKDAFGKVTGEILNGKRVSIKDFGTFYLIDRKARKGRNPQTGEEITIPASKGLKFKPARTLRAEVKNL